MGSAMVKKTHKLFWGIAWNECDIIGHLNIEEEIEDDLKNLNLITDKIIFYSCKYL